jgi:hypothetical protein
MGAIMYQKETKMKRLCMITTMMVALAAPAHALVRTSASASASANALARSTSIGVGNNFGNQSIRNSNAFSPTFNPTNTTTVGGQRNSQTTTVGGQNTTVNNIDPSSNNGNGGGWGNKYQAPAIFAPSAPPASGSCATALTFGASGPGAGLSFSLPWNDHRCDVRANSILLVNVLHLRKAGIQNACHDTEMAQALQASGTVCRVGPTVKQQ